ncbi:hypothetical protein HanXRQr2_Chr09g0409901 [Helianthus annuus]|uniref:Uncharacterized protein n=1 Tax=Helianthus annuus TaxID=4232 RepID=A0A9K3NAB7_HELAN|nr:hypothetical protein HanXRQr2_Chr09g0409901 [Helianthus annuus]KAJ0895045.1 hypothetical protein HanPSC8_Chr09g0395941 [Helianthus annuus]
MGLNMTMKCPNTGVIRYKPQSGPPVWMNWHCVLHNWVHQVIPLRVLRNIKLSSSIPDNPKIMPM